MVGGMKRDTDSATNCSSSSTDTGNALARTLDPDDFPGAQTGAVIERITRSNFRFLERLFPQISRALKINQLEAITDDVIEAAASILVAGDSRHQAIT